MVYLEGAFTSLSFIFTDTVSLVALMLTPTPHPTNTCTCINHSATPRGLNAHLLCTILTNTLGYSVTVTCNKIIMMGNMI